jgi:hypothetical protein
MSKIVSRELRFWELWLSPLFYRYWAQHFSTSQDKKAPVLD